MKKLVLILFWSINLVFTQKHFDDISPSNPYAQGMGNNSDYSFELNDISRSSWDPLHVWGTNADLGPVFVVSRNDTCIFSNENSLLIYDFTNPSNPQYITSIQINDYASWGDLVIRDNYLYVCNGSGGLEIFDITNLHNPSLVSQYENFGRPYSIAFLGDTAFVASRQAGLRVLDISDMTNPTEVDSFYLDDNDDNQADCFIDAITVVDGKPIIGDRCGNIMVLDFSGDTVYVVSEINPLGLRNWRLKSEGNIVYSLMDQYGIATIDVSDPSAMVFMDTIYWEESSGVNPYGWDIAEDYAYIPRNDKFQMINISNPYSLISENIIQHISLTYQDVHIDGNHAYITNTGGITAFDIASPSSVLLLGSVNNNDGGAWDITISDNDHLYADDERQGMIRIFDLNNLSNLQEISSISTEEGQGWTDSPDDHMTTNGNHLFYAYDSDGDSGRVRIYDVSNPSNPSYISTYQTPIGAIKEIMFYENSLILYGLMSGTTENNTYGIEILDVSNINNPIQLSLTERVHTHDINHQWMDMIIDNDTLISVMHCYSDPSYHNNNRIYTLDFFSITDPDNPQILSQDIEILGDFYGHYFDLAILQDKLYILTSNSGQMTVVNITDIQNCTIDTVYSSDWPDYNYRTNAVIIDTSVIDLLYHGLDQLKASSIDNEMFTIAETDYVQCCIFDSELNDQYVIISLENSGLIIYHKLTGIAPIVDVENDTIMEDSSAEFIIVDITETLVNVITSSDPPHVEGSFDSSEMILSLIPHEDWYGDAQILIQAYNQAHPDTATSSLILTVLPVNDAPFIDSLLTPTIADTFSTHSNSNQEITFSWDGGDIDNDVLFTLTIKLEFFGTSYTDIYENINDTIFNIPAENLDPLLSGLNLDESLLAWYVETADTQYSVTSPVGEFVVTRQELSAKNNISIPESYALHQNYPNPFNPVTTLRYDLPEDALVNITIYDMLGRQVKTLIDQTQDAGYRSIIWDATNDYGKPVSAGIYLYQIQAGEYISTKKMVLLK